MKQPKHGRSKTYNRGCRCDICREAASEYYRLRNAKKKQEVQNG